MTRARTIEEPCAPKVACTVLQTSVRGDPLAEFNSLIRHPVIWRKNSYGTHSEAGSKFLERLFTVVATLRLQGRDLFAWLTQAASDFFSGFQTALSLLPALES